MTTEPHIPAGGTPGGSSRTTQDVLDFLSTAPDELREWADATATAVLAEAQDSSEIDEPAEVTDDDDVLVGSRVTTPKDLRTNPVAPSAAAKRKGWHPSTVILATLVVAALVFGVYYIGQPGSDDAANPGMGAGQEEITAEDQARIAELEQLLAENPDDVPAHLELGVLLFNIGDDQRAEHHWLRVTIEDPTNPQAWFNLGFLYLSADEPDLDAARYAWETLLEVAPDSDLAQVARNHMEVMLTGGEDPHGNPGFEDDVAEQTDPDEEPAPAEPSPSPDR